MEMMTLFFYLVLCLLQFNIFSEKIGKRLAGYYSNCFYATFQYKYFYSITKYIEPINILS